MEKEARESSKIKHKNSVEIEMEELEKSIKMG